MNRFRLVLAFVFMLASTVSLIAYLALQVGVIPVSNEPHLVLWDVVGNDGLYLAIVFVLLGLGWLHFGQIFASEMLAKRAATIDAAS
jgi:hypothetical protein